METWKWTKFENLGGYPQPKTAPSLNYLDGVLYLVGGEADASPDPYKPEFYKYDLRSYSWEEVSALKSFVNRNLHGSCIFDNYLYLFYGWSNLLNSNVDSIDRIQLNSSSATWEQLEVEPTNENLLRSTYGYACLENKVYMFGGYSAQTLRNSVLQFDLSQLPLTYQFLAHDYYGPLSRTEHSLVVINAEFYLFGGINNERVLGDFWKYNEALNKWSEIQVEGTSPSARMRHAADSFADNMLIWGGENESGLLNDIYIYNAFLKSWRAIEVSGTLIPSARKNLCVGLFKNQVFLYGGITEAGFSDELWKFEIGSQTYELISKGEKGSPGPLADHYCKLEQNNGSIKFYVMFGRKPTDEPLGSVYYFDIATSKWYEVFNNGYNYMRNRERASIAKIKNQVFVLGGTTWTLQAYDTFFSLNLDTLNYTDYPPLEEVSYSGASVYFRDSLFVHSGGSTYGGSLRTFIPVNSFKRFDLSTLENKTLCSPGTFRTQEKCSICPIGTFASDYESSYCTQCEPGTYNPYTGATSIYQCKPCPYGSFSSRPGSPRCYNCPFGDFCYVGSDKIYNKEIKSAYNSIQPDVLELIDEENSVLNQILIFSVVLALILLVSFLIFRRNLGSFVKKLDLYDQSHNYKLNKPMYLRKTVCGGLFSIVFIILAIWVITESFVIYFEENIQKTVSLVPFVLLENENPEIKSDFNITVKLYNFGSSCLVADACSPNIVHRSLNVNGRLQKTCYYEEYKVCSINFFCKDCEIQTAASIEIEVSDLFTHASAIELNMNSGASNPNKVSTIIQRILSDYPKVFLGYQPTVFSVSAIPSVTLT